MEANTWQIIDPYNGPLTSSSTSTPSPTSTRKVKGIAGRASVSPFIAILAIVAAFTRYCLMA